MVDAYVHHYDRKIRRKSCSKNIGEKVKERYLYKKRGITFSGSAEQEMKLTMKTYKGGCVFCDSRGKLAFWGEGRETVGGKS